MKRSWKNEKGDDMLANKVVEKTCLFSTLKELLFSFWNSVSKNQLYFDKSHMQSAS